MSTNTSLPTPDECFISVLLDEWIEDSHCFDSQEAWESNPKRKISFTEIDEYLCRQEIQECIDQQKLPNGNELGILMAKEALCRISDIANSTDICPGCLVKAVVQVSILKQEWLYSAKEQLISCGMHEEDEIFLRCVSLYLNVLHGEWPFKYVGPKRASEGDNG